MTKIQLSNLVFLLSGMSLACDININDDSGNDGNDDGADGNGTAGDDDDDSDGDDDDDDDDDDDAMTSGDDDDDDDDDDDATSVGQDDDSGSGGDLYVCEAYGLWAEECLELDADMYAEYCFDYLEYAYNASGLECASAVEEAFACLALTPCEEITKETCLAERAAAAKTCGFDMPPR